MRPDLVRKLFGLDLMGVEVPEAYGGAGSSFFNAILVIEELAKVDPAVAVLVDVQNTLVDNCLINWASEDQKQRYLPRLCRDQVGAYALSEPGSGSDAFALATRAVPHGRRLPAGRQQALHHQRPGGRHLRGVRHRGPGQRATRGSPPSSWSAACPASR